MALCPSRGKEAEETVTTSKWKRGMIGGNHPRQGRWNVKTKGTVCGGQFLLGSLLSVFFVVSSVVDRWPLPCMRKVVPHVFWKERQSITLWLVELVIGDVSSFLGSGHFQIFQCRSGCHLSCLSSAGFQQCAISRIIACGATAVKLHILATNLVISDGCPSVFTGKKKESSTTPPSSYRNQ